MPDNPFAKYGQPSAQATPVYSGVNPDDARADASAARADRAAADATAQRVTSNDIASRRLGISERDEARTLNRESQGFDATEGERKSGAFLIRAYGAADTYDRTGVGARSYIGQALENNAPDLQNQFTEWPVGNSPERQVAQSAQNEFIAATLRQDSGAAIPPDELERQRRIYFPMPGEGEEVIEQKRQARARAIAGLEQSAGRLRESSQAEYNALEVAAGRRSRNDVPFPRRDDAPVAGMQTPPGGGSPPGGGTRAPTQREIYANGIQFGMDGSQDRGFDRAQYMRETYGLDGDDEDLIVGFYTANSGNDGLTPEGMRRWYEANGINGPVIGYQAAVDRLKSTAAGTRWRNINTADAEAARNAELDAAIEQRGLNPESQGDAFGAGAVQGSTLGGADELGGVIGRDGAISALLNGGNMVDGYQRERDIQRRMSERATDAHPWATLGGNMVGGLATGGLGMEAGGVRTASGAARIGALEGGITGFNSGEGAGGSLGGAALGAAGGAALGGALQYAGSRAANTLSQRLERRAADRAGISGRANALADAGLAENVTVNRAMVNPQSNNAVTRADASYVGGPTIQREMNAVAGQVEAAVTNNLGRGGRALDDVALGDSVENAALRAIKTTGATARRRYDRAEQLAADARVTPYESANAARDMIRVLSETPSTNKEEIKFLRSIASDLGTDLSVGSLRRMRTQLRKRISRGELTFGEDEARVLGIMDTAAADIRTGLAAQGKHEAARAFDTADRAYSARMEYIGGVLQKVLGKRSANRTAEAMARQVRSMTRNDERGLRQLYASMEPGEALDVSATFAAELGRRGGNGESAFSIPIFNTQTAGMSEGTLRTLFGEGGAQSVKNLRLLGREVDRVMSSMNSRTSKSGVAGNAQQWLFSLLGSAGVGAASSGTGGAFVAGTAGLAAKSGTELLSARALMSPRITKWLLQAPPSSSPAAINQWFGRLRSIAAREPALATDVSAIERTIMSWANDNGATVTNAAAHPAQQNQNGQPPAR